MPPPRIGDRDLAPAVRAETTTDGAGARVGAALASPVGILLVVPGLVAVVGLLLTLLGQVALRDSTNQLGRDRFAEQTEFIARGVASSLAQTDPMLDRMRELSSRWSATDASGPVAHALRGVMNGRSGIAYASVSYPDGTFQAAYLDDDGVVRFQEVRRDAQGAVMRRYDYEGIDGLVLRKTEPSSYDPRARGFYTLAVAKGTRVWTEPYTFFSSHHTGVTRTEPVFASPTDRTLRAVLTADYDVQALSLSMARSPLPGGRTLLYTRDGTVLAHPERAEHLPIPPARPLSYRDLGDPVIDAFFAKPRGDQAAGTFETFTAAGKPTLALVVPVPGFSELGWSVAAIVPESTFFRARIVHERQSMLAAAASLAAALGIAIIFSRHVVRVRRDATIARDQARKATEHAKELGSYRLLERLGEGGMGEVWRAEHRLLVRQAAIKLIRPQALASNPDAPVLLRERFRREAQTLATLTSRNTIELFDYGVTEDGTFFFVMELLDGMDLDSLVRKHGPLPAGRVIHLLVQACSSLAEAHDAGLVHRDIKPANLFLCRAADEVDIVKVLDFGLVQACAQDLTLNLTRNGDPMGTPAFMAPEQILGQETDRRADLYGLGCVAVWLLSGRNPFEATGALPIMLAHVNDPVPELATLVAGGVTPALDRIVRQCLAKSPADRPRDARALADLLRRVDLRAEDAWTADQGQRWWSDHLSSRRIRPPE